MQDMQAQWDVSLLLIEKIQENRLFPRKNCIRDFELLCLMDK